MPVVAKRSSSDKIVDSIIILILIAMCIATLYPFIHITAVSFSAKGPVLRGEVTFWPIDITLDSYEKIFQSSALFVAYRNTIFVVVMGTFMTIFITAFAAYPLSKRHLVGRGVLAFLLTLTLWFDPGMIPRFLVVKELGLVDRLWAIILEPMMNAFHIIVMRSFFDTLPEDMEESARIDGANYGTVLFRIVIPLSKPVISTIALWKAVFYWNMFLQPLLYLQSRAKFTLQLILRDIIIANTGFQFGIGGLPLDQEFESVGEAVQAGTIIVATVPILLIYPFVQKYFVRGALLGSVKG